MPVVGPGHRQEPLHGDGHDDEDGAAQTQPGQYASTINSAKNIFSNVLSILRILFVMMTKYCKHVVIQDFTCTWDSGNRGRY